MARYLQGKLRLNSVFLLLFLVGTFGVTEVFAQNHPVTGVQTTNIGVAGSTYTDDNVDGGNYVDSIPCNPAPCTSAGARNSTQRFVRAGSVGAQGQIVAQFNTYNVANGDSLTPAGFVNPNPPATATVAAGSEYVGPSLDFQFRTTFDNNNALGWSAAIGVYDVDVIFDKTSLTTGESPVRPIFCAGQTDNFNLLLNYGRTTNGFRGYDSVIVDIPNYPGGALRRVITVGAGNAVGANQNVAVNGLVFPTEGIYQVDVYVYAYGVEMNATSSSIVVMDDIDFANVTFDAVNGEFICQGETETYQASANVPNSYTGDAAPYNNFGIKRIVWSVDNSEITSSQIAYSPSRKISDLSSFNIPTNLAEGQHDICFKAEFDINCGSGVVSYDTCFVVNIINPDAGQDVTFSVCETQASEDLNTRLTATADPGGTWAMSAGSADDLIGGGCFDPATGILDIDCAVTTFGSEKTYCFEYTSSGYGSCPDAKADICVIVDRLPDAGGPLPGNGSSPATAIETCASTGLLDLYDVAYFGARSTPDVGGQFDVDNSGATGIVSGHFWNPQSVSPGVIMIEYTVGEAISACPVQSSQIWFDIREEPFADGPVYRELCSTDPNLDLNTLRGASTPDETVSTATVTWEVFKMNPANAGVFTGGGPNNPINLIRPSRLAVSDSIVMHYIISNGSDCDNDTLEATIYIQLKPEAGQDVLGKEYCSTEVIDLDVEAPSALPRSSEGAWYDDLPLVPANLITNPNVVDLSGYPIGANTFYYFVPSLTAACEPDTAKFEFSIDQFLSAGLDSTVFICEDEGVVKPFSYVGGTPDIGGTFTIAPTTGPMTGTTDNADFDPTGVCDKSFVLTYTQNMNGACPMQSSNLTINVSCLPNVGVVKTATDDICTDTIVRGTPWMYDLKQHIGAEDRGVTDGSFASINWQFIAAGANPTLSGGLDNTLGADGILNAQLAGPGSFTIYYIVSSNGCDDDTLTYTININKVGNAGLDSALVTCTDGGQLLLADYTRGADLPATGNQTGRWEPAANQTGDVISPNTEATSTYNPEPAITAADTVYYIVEVPNCPNDTAEIRTYTSKKPRAGLGDTAFACSDNNAFDLYEALIPPAQFDRGKMGKWRIIIPSAIIPDATSRASCEACVNALLRVDPATFENNIAPIDSIVMCIQNCAPSFLCDGSTLNRLKLEYTASDSADFSGDFAGAVPPICSPVVETAELVIGRKYPVPAQNDALNPAAFIPICDADSAIDLNTFMIIDAASLTSLDSACGWHLLPVYPFDRLLNDDFYKWEGTGPDGVVPAGNFNGNILDISDLRPGNYTFTVTVTSVNCEDEVTGELNIRIVRQPEVGPDKQTFVVCSNDIPINLETLLDGNAERGGTFTMTDAAKDQLFGLNCQTAFNNGPAGGVADRPVLKCQPISPDITVVDAFTYIKRSTELPNTCFGKVDVTLNWKQGPAAGTDFSMEVCGDSLVKPLRNAVDTANASAIGFEDMYSTVGINGITIVFVETPIGPHVMNGSSYTDAVFQADNTDEIVLVDYIVSKPGCKNDTARITVQERVQLDAGNNVTDTLCSNVGALDLESAYIGPALNGGDISGDFYRCDALGVTLNVAPVTSFNPSTNVANRAYYFKYIVGGNNSCKKDSAIITIYVEKSPSAGTNSVFNFCETADWQIDLNIPDTLQKYYPGADLGGVFTPIPPAGAIFIAPSTIELAGAPTGTYKFRYLVDQTNYCPLDSATLTIRILPKFNPGTGADANNTHFAKVCNSASTFHLFNGVLVDATAGGSWKNGNLGHTDPARAIAPVIRPKDFAPGTYDFFYTVPDALLPGCGGGTARVVLEIIAAPNAGKDTIHDVCITDNLVNLATLISGPNLTSNGVFELHSNTTAGLSGTFFNLNNAQPALPTPNYYLRYVASEPACGTTMNDTAFITLNIINEADAGGDVLIKTCYVGQAMDLANPEITPAGVAGGRYRALTSSVINTPGAFFGSTFTTTGFRAGLYTFEYVTESTRKVCPNDSSIITVEIVEYAFDTTLYACTNEKTVDLNAYYNVPKGKGLTFVQGSGSPGSINAVNKLFDTQRVPGTYEFTLDFAGYFVQNIALCEVDYTLVIADTLKAKPVITCNTDEYTFKVSVTGGNPNQYKILTQDGTGAYTDVTTTRFNRNNPNEFEYNLGAVPVSTSLEYFIVDQLNCIDTVRIVVFADCKDSDGDGTPDIADIDVDNDGIINTVESGGFKLFGDLNANGVVDYADPEFCAAAGGTFAFGACNLWDFDNDGIVNALDLDSDNDGIFDLYEAFATPLTYEGPDLDGITGPGTYTNGHLDIAVGTPLNTDGTDGPDYLDLDSDNDGIPDAIEKRSTDYLPENFDGDGLDNFRDLDSDNDGILDALEKNQDYDEDGLPNYVDEDSDDDGIPDSDEALPLNADGTPHNTIATSAPDYRNIDSDGDGIYDALEGIPYHFIAEHSQGISPQGRLIRKAGDTNTKGWNSGIKSVWSIDSLVNTDMELGFDNSDTIPDFRDLDSDGDGIPDAIEVVVRYSLAVADINMDGDSSSVLGPLYNWRDLDSDNDGISDKIEGSEAGKINDTFLVTRLGTSYRPPFVNLDSDYDGIPDIWEFYALDVAASLDPIANRNGQLDGENFSDSDEDGWDDVSELLNPITSDAINTDADNGGEFDLTPDYLDFDSDGDGIYDFVEVWRNNSGFVYGAKAPYNFTYVPTNTDREADGPDFRDLDADDDGLLDEIEKGGDGQAPADSDGDTNPDFRDIDSDDDGISDRVEKDDDCDGDGIPDYVDPIDEGCTVGADIPEGFSPNGDGVNDTFRINFIEDFPNNTLTVFNRWGGKVYEKSNYDNTWDGTNSDGIGNGELPAGTYYYLLDLGIDQDPIKGFVYINR